MKIRVLEVLPTLKRAGAENVAVSLTCGLDGDRFEAAVVSLYDRFAGGLEPVLQDCGVRVWHLEKRRGFDVRMWPRLTHVLRDYRPDVVHTHSYVLRYVLPAARHAAVIHTAHNLAGRDPDWITGAFNRIAFRRGVSLVAVSAAVAHSYKRMYGFEPLATIPNGIDLARFRRPESREPWRRAHGFSSGEILIASVARLEPQKDPGTLVRAFARGLAAIPHTHLLLAGEGSLSDSLRSAARSLGVEGRVHLLGVCSDVPALLSACDLLALSSRWEGSPVTVLEAMAAGLPVVATAVGGVPELVDDGTTGILVRPGNEQELGDALASLVKAPARRLAMGQAAGMRAHCFSVEAMVKAYEEIFSRIAGKPQ
ncbi:MAG: glycosyltransferase [Bryobacteraceae bacterium]